MCVAVCTYLVHWGQVSAFVLDNPLYRANRVRFAKLVNRYGGEVMNGPKVLDELSAKLKQAVDGSPAKDIEKNIRAVLAGVFSRLDLVTREEFDVQREVLLRTREKLVDLERAVAELEARSSGAPRSAPDP